jgi:hypothetical protein
METVKEFEVDRVKLKVYEETGEKVVELVDDDIRGKSSIGLVVDSFVPALNSLEYLKENGINRFPEVTE